MFGEKTNSPSQAKVTTEANCYNYSIALPPLAIRFIDWVTYGMQNVNLIHHMNIHLHEHTFNSKRKGHSQFRF